LKRYISETEESNIAVAGIEDLNDEQKLNEFVMLSLRSKGLVIEEMKNLFGEMWLNEKSVYLEKLEKENFLQCKNGLISLTKSGYCVCDEILKNLL
jgi:coproporphyrinogen III oxidase-like Fe-S oxidoreductase